MSQYIGFTLGKEEYVISILVVQEIMKPAQTTKLPHTPQHVLGIINLRGKTISVIDLKRKLGLDSDCSELGGKVIVTNIGRVTFGVKVDTITGVMEIDDNTITRDIELVCNRNNDECLRGVANLGENRMVIIIDLSKILNKDDMEMLSAGSNRETEIDYTVKSPAMMPLEDMPEKGPIEKGNGKISERLDAVEQNETAEHDDDVTGQQQVSEAVDNTSAQKTAPKSGDDFVQEVQEAFEKSVGEKGFEQGLVHKIMDEVKGLIDAFANGDIEKAEKVIMSLSNYGERDLFSEVGKMTRKLHDSFNIFKQLIDPRLADIAQDDMPEVTDKLEWVITKTDEAAGKTIGIAERNQSKLEELMTKLDFVEEKLNELDCTHSEEKVSLSFVKTELSEISNDFIEIMLAQEFQDLTGQILKKVIRLVRELEEQLLRLVVYFGTPEGKKAEVKKPEELAGPQIKAGEGIMSQQGDVDALLAEFGF